MTLLVFTLDISEPCPCAFSINSFKKEQRPFYFVFATNSVLMTLDAGPPSPAAHLRDVFYRMGLNDKVIYV